MAERRLERVLYVEDEPDIREVAQLALEAVGGLTVQACDSGQQALDLVAGFDPDVILLDVMMPGMDGPATLAALRALPAIAETPVVFMTAKVQAREIAEYLEFGAIGVIRKPFDPMTLADELRRMVQGGVA